MDFLIKLTAAHLISRLIQTGLNKSLNIVKIILISISMRGCLIFPLNIKNDSNDSIKIAITFILGKISALEYWATPAWENPWKPDTQS